jgi:dCTP deaminase
MLLPASRIAELLQRDISDDPDPLVIAPTPNLARLKAKAGASVDLRLGTWFFAMKARRWAVLDEQDSNAAVTTAGDLGNRYYVPFSRRYVLHPRSFVLATTLEWIRLPRNLGATVTGKSSWGRRGLIIETAPGVHPGFSGCLALEVTNVGEIPIALWPGVEICQLTLQRLDSELSTTPKTQFRGYRYPVVTLPSPDDFARKLRQ